MRIRQQKRKAAEESTQQIANTVSTEVKQSVKKTSGRRTNAIGQSKQLLVGRGGDSLPSSAAQSPCPRAQGKGAEATQILPVKGQNKQLLVFRGEDSLPSSAARMLCFPEATKKLPVKAQALCPQTQGNGSCFSEATKILPVKGELDRGQKLNRPAKIKLQLFPIDEGTRIALEKDGHHPYLELTLSARKKISSVLKHINAKWGSSKIALGEPRLFPYYIGCENKASRETWTLNDSSICAGDVYATIGSPDIFRLRYGWFSNPELNPAGILSTYTPFENRSESEGAQKRWSTNIGNTYSEGKQIEVTRTDFQPIDLNEAANSGAEEEKSLNVPSENGVRMESGLGQSSMNWDDNLTNISFGDLLSEISMQGRFTGFDPKSNGSNMGLAPSQLISDSFDAFISAHVNGSQASRPVPDDTRSSILDAEQTNHAFSFPKFSSSGRDVLSLGGSAYSSTCSRDAVSKSCRIPLAEVNGQVEARRGQDCQELKTEPLLCLHDDSSLGLRGIKWTDSLGPFDLGLSSSRKIAG